MKTHNIKSTNFNNTNDISNQIYKDHKKFIFPCVLNYYQKPIIIKKAKNLTITDINNKEYLDFFGGIVTISLNHCNDELNKNIIKQINTLGHTSTLYITNNAINVAKQLSKLTPGQSKKCFFSNSGTEANETAIMLAKIYTQCNDIIALRHGYSGRSQLTTDITGNKSWKLLDTITPGIKHAHAPYCYRCPMKLTYPACNLQCAHDIKELIETATCGKIAAFLAEPIQGVGGFIVPPDDYFQTAIKIIRNYGGVFICDEVQTGLGRTGKFWLGIEHNNINPEIITMAKGLANGFPAAVTIADTKIANVFTGLSISTFGGNPISMAAINSTLNIIQKENLLYKSFKLGNYFLNAIKEMQIHNKFIGDVRGKGLMLAIELVENKLTKEPSPHKTNLLMEFY